MTTPAQEAKEFAAKHDFVIRSVGRRYAIFDGNSTLIDEVGGYPAALNAMKRYVEQALETSDPVGIPADTIVGEKPAFVLTHVAIVDNAPDFACKVAPEGWDKVETSVEDEKAFHAAITEMHVETFKRSVEDWNAGKVRHPFAPRLHRTGWYVRVTKANGEVINDIFCSNMKEAYRTCAQTANWFKRNGFTPVTKRSVIFKRGA